MPLGSFRTAQMVQGNVAQAAVMWYNKTATDIAHYPGPLLMWLEKMCKREKPKMAADIAVRLRDQRQTGAKAYRYADHQSTDPSPGPTGARVPVSWYSCPVICSEQELAENQYETEIDLWMFKMEGAELALKELLEQDAFYGNALDDRKILGLEDILFATPADGSFGATRARWQYRQQTDVHMTVDRSPFTAMASGGTGWEACTESFAGQTVIGIDATTLEYNATYRVLLQLINAATYGTMKPRHGFTTEPLFNKLQATQSARLRVTTTTGNFMGYKGDIVMPSIMVGEVELTYSDWAYQASINGDDAEAGGHSLYALNPMFHHWDVDPTRYFKATTKKEPFDQFVGGAWVRARVAHYCDSPRMECRAYDVPLS